MNQFKNINGGEKIFSTGEVNSKDDSGSSKKPISQENTKKQKEDITTYSKTKNTVTISTKHTKPRFQKNNTKDNPPKYEHLADLSDSTFETIHIGRKKLRTGRTQFQCKNQINLNTVYNNIMKQNRESTAPTKNNINRNPNLIRKQNKYMGSIKNSKKQHSQQNKINPNPIQIKNSRTNDKHQNNNMKQSSNNTTTHRNPKFYENIINKKYPPKQDPTNTNIMKQKEMNAETYTSNIPRDCSTYIQRLRQHRINKSNISIENPYNSKQNNTTYRQNNHTTTRNVIETSDHDMNKKINTINSTTHSTLELDNNGIKTNDKNLNSRNNPTKRPKDNPTESKNKTNTKKTIKNPESSSKVCHSDSNSNSTNNNTIIQRKKTSESQKRDSIKTTINTTRIRHISKQKQTKTQNITERIGTVRKSKKTSNVESNTNKRYSSKHVATKKDNVPQQTVITPSDDPT